MYTFAKSKLRERSIVALLIVIALTQGIFLYQFMAERRAVQEAIGASHQITNFKQHPGNWYTFRADGGCYAWSPDDVAMRVTIPQLGSLVARAHALDPEACD